MKVVFDTGSEFLTVTSSLCSDSTTPEQFKFKKYNDSTKSFVDRAKLEERCSSSAYDISKSES